MEFKMQTRPTPTSAITLEKASFFPRVYGWMALGLLVSAAASFALLSSPAALKFVFGSKVVYFGLILGELGLVFYLSSRVMSMSPAAAKGTFLAFAGLNGVTLASIFLVYTAGSIASTRVRDGDETGPDGVRQLRRHGPLRDRHRVGGEPLPPKRGGLLGHHLYRGPGLRRAFGLRHLEAEANGGDIGVRRSARQPCDPRGADLVP
ncbi:MAG: membrane protein [Actinobacteria bacterium]|nr:membrane protein [Actinomycetota bacterium]